ncbi:cobyrinic acid a,c-diamide synthase [Saccharomonospora sp. NPDC006951]
MSRRASLPGASELFRRTSSPTFGDSLTVETSPRTGPEGDDGDNGTGNGHAGNGNGNGNGTGNGNGAAHGYGAGAAQSTGTGRGRGSAGSSTSPRRGSGRQKHDAKITVYVAGDELLAMEHARLTLRGEHGLVVDRGRIVREAVAVLLADFDQHGADSVLVRRLSGGGVDAEEATN